MLDKKEDLDHHISLVVCIDGVILYTELEYGDCSDPKSLTIFPLSACKYTDEGENDATEAPSTVCNSEDCPWKCPFNDTEKEQEILKSFREPLAKYAKLISKEIYGIEVNLPISDLR